MAQQNLSLGVVAAGKTSWHIVLYDDPDTVIDKGFGSSKKAHARAVGLMREANRPQEPNPRRQLEATACPKVPEGMTLEGTLALWSPEQPPRAHDA